MQATSFNNWKHHPCTIALMNYLNERICELQSNSLQWDDVLQPSLLARKIGISEGLMEVLNITKEDLKEDESEGY